MILRRFSMAASRGWTWRGELGMRNLKLRRGPSYESGTTPRVNQNRQYIRNNIW